MASPTKQTQGRRDKRDLKLRNKRQKKLAVAAKRKLVSK
jgi:hypothetical protein